MEAINELQDKVKVIRRRALDRHPKELDPNVIPFNCNVIIELRDGKTGVVKETHYYTDDPANKDARFVHNLITTAGKNLLLAWSGTKYIKDFSRIAIGTGTTNPAAGDTALETEVARSAALTGTNPSANILQFQTTFAAGVGTGAITEVGLFDANSSGNMLNRSEFAAVNKGASDELTMTVQIT